MTNKKHLRNLEKVTRKNFRPFANMGNIEDALQDKQNPFDFSYIELESESCGYKGWRIIPHFTISPRRKIMGGHLERYEYDHNPDFGSNYSTTENQFENIHFEQVPYLLAYLRLDPKRFLAEIPYGIETKEFSRLFSKFAKEFVLSYDKEVIATTPAISNGKKVDGKQIQIMVRYEKERNTMYSFLSEMSQSSARLVISSPDYYLFGGDCNTTQKAIDRTTMMREVNKQLEDKVKL